MDLTVKAVLQGEDRSLSSTARNAARSLDDIGRSGRAGQDGVNGLYAALGRMSSIVEPLQNTNAFLSSIGREALAATAPVNTLASAHQNLSVQGMAAFHASRSMVEGLAAGMPIQMLFAQQIAHLSFAASGPGGLKGAFEEAGGALSGFLTPLTASLALVVATSAAVIYGADKIWEYDQRQRAFAATMTLSGQALGLTVEQYVSLAQTQADAADVSFSTSKTILQSMTSAGMGSVDVFKLATQGAHDWSEATVKSADDVSKELAKGMRDPVEGLKELRQEYGQTGSAVIQMAADFEAQGDSNSAQLVFIKEWGRLAREAAGAAKDWHDSVPSSFGAGIMGGALPQAQMSGAKTDNTPGPLYSAFLQNRASSEKANDFADGIIRSLDPVTAALRKLGLEEKGVNDDLAAHRIDQAKADTAINLILQKRGDLLDQLSSKSKQQAEEAERKAQREQELLKKVIDGADTESYKVGTQLFDAWKKVDDAAEHAREQREAANDRQRAQASSENSSGLQGLSIYSGADAQAARLQDATNQLWTWRMTQLQAIQQVMGGNQALMDQTEEIYNDRLRQIYEDDLRRRTDWSAGIQRANLDVTRSTQDMATRSETFLKGWSQQGEDWFASLRSSGMKNIGDLADFVEEQMLRIAWAQNLAGPFNSVGNSIVGAIGSLLGVGGIDTVVASPMNATLAAIHHEGGMAGAGTAFRYVHPSYFDTAPRHHTGRSPFGANEVPAILEKSELVLNTRQQGMVSDALDAGGGAPPKLIVNVYGGDSKPTPKNAQRQSDGSWSFDLFIDQVDDALAAKQSKGASSFGDTLVTQHGLQKDVKG